MSIKGFLAAALSFLLSALPLSASTVIFTGFESGSVTEFLNEGTSSYQTGTVRTGTYALRVNPSTSGTGDAQIDGLAANGSKLNQSSVATSYFRFYFRYATKPASASEPILGAREDTSSTFKFAIRITSGGNLAAYRNADATLLATGSTTLSSGTWYLIETKVGTGASTAPWEIKINGVSEISGADNLTANNTSRFYVGKFENTNSQTVDFFYDDVLWSNSAYPGEGQCSALITSANGTYQTATIGAGAGSHYQIVQTIPPANDTSYLVTDGTSGHSESEQVNTRSGAGITVTGVHSVLAFVDTKLDNSLNSASIKNLLRSNTTDLINTSASSQALNYGGNFLIADTDPATASAWNPVALDTLEVGLRNTSINSVRLTLATVFVDYTSTPTVTESGYVH